MNATAKTVLTYTLLPQMAPRIRNLFGSGFSFLAFFLAQIFVSVQLLPRHHPYLMAANTGRFSIKHVVYEGWRHLRFDLKNLDRVLIFFTILVGLVILIAQFALLFLGVFAMSSAMAMALPVWFDTMFITPNPESDIAFIVLDRVFGLPDFFGSCVDLGTACFGGTQYNPQNIIVDTVFPTPFHIAFHEMLSVYSYGMIMVAAIIITYLVITVIGETAQTGTPFGTRFNHVWVPLRFVVALGLLIPTATGLNSAQYIVLYAAKWGSGFATNGWNMFLDGAGLPAGGMTILGTPDTLVGTPETPPVNNILEFGSSLGACIKTQKFFYNRDIKGYIVNPAGMTAATSRIDIASTPTYDQVLEFENYGDIYFVFGEYLEDAGNNPVHSGYPAYVRPYCGELILQITDVADAYSPGSRVVLEAWFNMIAYVLWYDASLDGGVWASGSMGLIGTNAARKHIAGYPAHDTNLEIVSSDTLADIRDGYINFVEATITAGVTNQRTAPSWDEMDDYGWAGAGLWYGKIAEMNGMLLSAVNTMPNVRAYPEVMEEVLKERQKYDPDITGPERFLPRRADGTEVNLNDPTKYKEAEVLYAAFKVWGSKTSTAQPTGNMFIDTIHAFFGTKGLYNMAKNTDIHPLAQLVGVGKTLVESSVRNLGASFFSGVAGGAANLFAVHKLGDWAGVVSGIFSKVAMIGLTAGFLLFYVVPFLPFIYFFFALGTWVKTLLEAMVGVPLWALAHLRIDGNGLPGPAAISGYYLILEVFIRPICTVFGLLASIAILTAQVKILHEIWPLVTSNLTGFDSDQKAPPAPDKLGGIVWYRGLIDQFLFTIMYTFVVYMMAMASFKLIDLVPDFIMRWLGTNVTTFGGISKDENMVAGMPTRAVIGVGVGIERLQSAAGNLGQAVSALGPRKSG